MSTTTAPEVLTPTLRTTGARARFWILGIAAIVLVGIVMLVAERGVSTEASRLDPDSAAPGGTRALVEVLRDQGVEVHLVTSITEMRRAVAAADSATVVLHDPTAILDEQQRAQFLRTAARLVVLEPGLAATADLAPEIGLAGSALDSEQRLDSACALPAAERAGEIRGTGFGYRILDDSTGAVGCFPAGDDIVALVQLPRDNGDLVILGATSLLTNEEITLAGNAALALNLLGEDATLVWYVPGVDDLRAGDELPSILDLTATWATPLALLAVLVVIAAGVWRGRRFGPLVRERLPVIVRSSETMEGRARLYERADARLHALDALRMAALGRLATRVGLSRRATVDEIVAAVASLTGRDRSQLHDLLAGAAPHSDADLLRISDELGQLERTVAQLTTSPPTR
ncbi:DUF4350 domain-containing protein [uncultured Schumannella sp.]|uniref:DUF4350 domain-containing protein n=1 Tax=uncultured Schumannella sp. TaxID=1195956 RepID=UPI0025E36BCF|nr:DUF4350 domain-containing protein [uncultured Schumannella sp.]